jgi:copper chaperone
MATTVLTVPDISCEHCEHAITAALAPQQGIEAVAVDIPAREVRVSFDERRISIDEMKKILAEEDYPVASAD